MSRTMDTAAASTTVGDPALTDGKLPVDTLGDPASLESKDQAQVHTASSLDQLAQEHAATAAATQAAAFSPPPGSPGATNGDMSARILTAAEHYLGTPYQWGGTSGSGIDCSGLVQAVYKAVGINLPRISYQQANSGQRVNLKDLRVGDLVAWDNSSRNNGADHIAIYVGNGMIIEAARPGTSVRYSKIYDTAQAWGVRMAW